MGVNGLYSFKGYIFSSCIFLTSTKKYKVLKIRLPAFPMQSLKFKFVSRNRNTVIGLLLMKEIFKLSMTISML